MTSIKKHLQYTNQSFSDEKGLLKHTQKEP